jgi:hypothetical protein
MLEAGIQMSTESSPETPSNSWELLRTEVDDCLVSLDARLQEYGPLQPDRFSLQEANERLDLLMRQRSGHESSRRGREHGCGRD